MNVEGEKTTKLKVCLGGILSRLSGATIDDVDGGRIHEGRSSFRGFLASTEAVGRVFAVGEDKAQGVMESYGPLCVGLDGGREMMTHCWEIPVIFKMDVKKGFAYEDGDGEKVVAESPLRAVVVYDGVWFMAGYDPNQCADANERGRLEVRIRDVLVHLMKKAGQFIPQIVAPCVIPAEISLEISSRAGERLSGSFPRYLDSEWTYYDVKAGRVGLRQSHLLVKYVSDKVEVADDEVATVMADIHSSIGMSMRLYYFLEALSDWHLERKREMVERYREMCGAVEGYLKISNWNLVKKSIISNKLGKETTRLQMRLVDSTLWDDRIMRRSAEIDSYQLDEMKIIEYLRGYLKASLCEPYEGSREEYEALVSVISKIDSITSQHNFVLLSLIAVIAGFIGAIIGSLLS